jgi:hypothetical protein
MCALQQLPLHPQVDHGRQIRLLVVLEQQQSTQAARRLPHRLTIVIVNATQQTSIAQFCIRLFLPVRLPEAGHEMLAEMTMTMPMMFMKQLLMREPVRQTLRPLFLQLNLFQLP